MFELLPDKVSPFEHKLNTNFVPTVDEINYLRSLLADPTEELARIDAEIDGMDIIIRRLRAERALLQTTIDAHRALISPMRRVPDDVLREIFFACLPDTHNALIDPAEAPILLERICKHWRVVSHSTPMLWSTIHIPPLSIITSVGHYAKVFSQLKTVVEQWFQRAATCPLTVSIVEYSHDGSDSDQHPISLLLDFSQRLRHLALAGRTGVLLPLLRLGPESMPLLKSIRLKIFDSVSFGTDHPDAMNAVQIPSLTDISLKLRGDPLSLPLKWSRLTGLSLQCSWSNQHSGLDGGVLEVFRRCPNLRRCHVELTGESGLASNATPISLPHLHTLIFTGFGCRFPKWIPYLDVPKLRYLQVAAAKNINPFTNIRSEYGSHMTVALDSNFFTQPGLLEVLSSFPMIRHLRLSSGQSHLGRLQLNDAFLLHLSSMPDLCPSLTHLSVSELKSSDATALAFIRTRMAGPAPLQLFEADFHRPMQIDIMPDLQPFIADGLKVELKYSAPPPRWAFHARNGIPVLDWALQ